MGTVGTDDIVILFQRVVSMKSNVAVTPPQLPGLTVNDSLVHVILKKIIFPQNLVTESFSLTSSFPHPINSWCIITCLFLVSLLSPVDFKCSFEVGLLSVRVCLVVLIVAPVSCPCPRYWSCAKVKWGNSLWAEKSSKQVQTCNQQICVIIKYPEVGFFNL